MIVEDEAIVAADLAAKVRQLGYEVAGTTATGEEAVELACRQRPALVLMDIRLAGAMDGITAAEQIHRECHLPVLFLTAHSDMGTVERARQAEAFGYLLKPFDERDLRIQIEMALYKHTAEQQLRERKEQLTGINQILQAALACATEEELGTACLEVAEKITQSKFGFIGEINESGLEVIAISNPGWDACNVLDSGENRRQPGNFKIHGIYGRVLLAGKSLFTNASARHPDSIGLPPGHPPLASFLGVPLLREGRTIGMLAVGNRDGGYAQAEQDALEALAPSIVEAFLRKRAEEGIRKTAADLQTVNSKLLESRRAALNMMEDALAARQQAEETSFELQREISQRKRAEELLRLAYDDLEQRVRERTEDLATTVETLLGEIAERERAERSLKRLNRLYEVLSETNQAIVRVVDHESLFRDFCRIAVEHGGFILSWVGLVDEETGQVRIVAANGATAYLDEIRITVNNEPTGEGPTGIAIRQGSYCICNDFQNDPCTQPWHEQGKVHGIRASASVALKEGERVVGALTLYSGEKDFFDRQHVALLKQMGADISFALDNFTREHRRLKTEQSLREETLERLRTLEELREKEQMLIQQSRLAAMGEMINNIAHQWRQPLNVMGLIVQQMQLYYEVGTFSKEFLDASVVKSMDLINHMSHTIDDFRDFFKPDKDKGEFRVKEVISKTLTLIEDGLMNQEIAIDFQCNADPKIDGYANEYSQVLLNILMNARDALMEQGPKNAQITVTVDVEADKSVVTIADNAGGIPEENLFKIFEPYFTTKGPDKGTGVGLFMSKTIIEKNMAGRLTVRNNDGGAEFRIEV
nr:GAF domain-containing protein [Geoanaerobacter pelophilus]